jgi:hypothetical protein
MMVQEEADVEEAMLAETRTEVGYADNKASFVLAALGIGFGAIIGSLLGTDWKAPNEGIGEVAWWVGACMAVLSVALAGAAVWPRSTRRRGRDDIYYWADVARLPTAADLAQQLNCSPPISKDRTRDQLWQLSKIVASKYSLIRGALVSGGLAVVAFLIAVAFD